MQKGEKANGGHDPNKAFDFEFEQTIVCTKCNCYRKVTEKESLLNLVAPVSGKVEAGTPVQLNDCLDKFFTPVEVSDVQCHTC